MKRIDPLYCLLLLLIVFASCHKDSAIKKKSAQGINLDLNSTELHQATADNAFTFNLFKTVQAGNSSNNTNNVFLSPLSVSFALGMTANGAKGATLDGIKSTLDFSGFTQDEMNSYYDHLITDLPKLDPQTTLNIANSIWYRQGFSVLPQFITTDSSYFHATIQGLDFNNPSSTDVINGWVNKQTNGKIPSIVGQISPGDVMYLINAIYFKSIWNTKFDASQTHPASFYTPDGSTVQASFMKGTVNYNFFADDKATVVELPYINNKYSMVIMYPNGSNTLNNAISSMDTANWNHYVNNMHAVNGLVNMPKFKFSYSILLNDALSQLGMGNAFSGSADFTGINSAGGLQITKVQHKAFVAVDESGTEAAAVTSVTIGLTAVLNPPVITIDHPFLFVIREMKSGLILFEGTVNNPLLVGE
ncbi:MAG TPA: serpin family protein [Mucilaginibacter sp.]